MQRTSIRQQEQYEGQELRRVQDINSKALFMPCASHTLNLFIADAAKSTIPLHYIQLISTEVVHFQTSRATDDPQGPLQDSGSIALKV